MQHEAGESGPDAMQPAAIEVPVTAVFEAVDTAGRWSSRSWRLAAVEPAAAPGRLAIALHRDEAQGYYLNLSSAEPSIFVMWRLDEASDASPEAVAATLSYDEAGRWMDGGERVDRVPMPAEMRGWLAEFVAAYYRPEAGRKRRGPKASFMERRELADLAERERELAARAGGPAADGGTTPGDERR